MSCSSKGEAGKRRNGKLNNSAGLHRAMADWCIGQAYFLGG